MVHAKQEGGITRVCSSYIYGQCVCTWAQSIALLYKYCALSCDNINNLMIHASWYLQRSPKMSSKNSYGYQNANFDADFKYIIGAKKFSIIYCVFWFGTDIEIESILRPFLEWTLPASWSYVRVHISCNNSSPTGTFLKTIAFQNSCPFFSFYNSSLYQFSCDCLWAACLLYENVNCCCEQQQQQEQCCHHADSGRKPNCFFIQIGIAKL